MMWHTGLEGSSDSEYYSDSEDEKSNDWQYSESSLRGMSKAIHWSRPGEGSEGTRNARGEHPERLTFGDVLHNLPSSSRESMTTLNLAHTMNKEKPDAVRWWMIE
jgi:hypothetical protein